MRESIATKLLVCGGLLLISACLSEPPSATPVDATSIQSITHQDLTKNSSLALGSGYRPFDETGNVERTTCLDFTENDVSLTPTLGSGVRAFASRTQSSYEYRLRSTLDAGVDIEGVLAEAQVETSAMFSSQRTEAVLTLAATIKTGRRSLNVEPAPNDQCSSDEQYCSIYSNCGSMWVQSEYLGGYFYLDIDLAKVDEEVRAKLTQEFGVSAADSPLGIEQSLDMAADIMQDEESASLTVHSYGFDPPLPQPKSGDGAVDYLERLIGVLQELRCGADGCGNTGSNPAGWGYVDALAEDAPYHYSLGAVIARDFLYYDESFVSDCAGQWDSRWDCIGESADVIEAFIASYRDLEATAEYYVDNVADFDWGHDPAATLGEMDDRRNFFETCAAQFEAIRNTCHQTISQCEEPAMMCDACTLDGNPNLPQECLDLDDPVVSDFNDLLARISPAGAPRMETVDQYTSGATIGAIADDFCWLGYMSGRFEGTGEAVEVADDAATGWWKLRADSQRTKNSERIRAGAYCDPLPYFWDGNDDLEYSQAYEASVFGTPSTSMRNATFPYGLNYSAAINGVRGHMQGTGERARIEPDTSLDAYVIEVASQQGDLVGSGHVFGVPNPNGGTTDRLVPGQPSASTAGQGDRGVIRKRLGPWSDGICVLNEVKGRFDGGGESVRLETDEQDWILRVSAGCEKRKGILRLGSKCKERKPVEAVATCYAYDQTN